MGGGLLFWVRIELGMGGVFWLDMKFKVVFWNCVKKVIGRLMGMGLNV